MFCFHEILFCLQGDIGASSLNRLSILEVSFETWHPVSQVVRRSAATGGMVGFDIEHVGITFFGMLSSERFGNCVCVCVVDLRWG